MQAERQARITEEKANLGPSNRLVEEEQLAKLLMPLNLGMREIKVGMCSELGPCRGMCGQAMSAAHTRVA